MVPQNDSIFTYWVRLIAVELVINFFKLFIECSLLGIDPSEWHTINDYKKAQEMTQKIKVVSKKTMQKGQLH